MMVRRSAAQALVWLTLTLPLLMSTAGLAIDGGLLLASRRELQSVADGAARAGATRLDKERLRGSAGADIQLDPALAEAAARESVDERPGQQLVGVVPPTTQRRVSGRRVHVPVATSMGTGSR